MKVIGGVFWEAYLHALRKHAERRNAKDPAPADPAELVEEVRREALEYLADRGYSVGRDGSGFLTVCCSCKRVRNGEHRWQSFEDYMAELSGVEITHGLCAECEKKLRVNG